MLTYEAWMRPWRFGTGLAVKDWLEQRDLKES